MFPDRRPRAGSVRAGGALDLGPSVLVVRATCLPAAQLLRVRANRQARLPAHRHYKLQGRRLGQVSLYAVYVFNWLWDFKLE